MPIFGLVWVASWVGCFFSSNQDLLRAPDHLSCALSIQAPSDINRSRGKVRSISQFASGSDYPLHSQSTFLSQSEGLSATAAFAPVSNSTSLPSPAAPGGLLRTLAMLLSGHRIALTAPLPASFNQASVAVVAVEPQQLASRQKGLFNSGFGQCAALQGDRVNAPTGLFQVRYRGYLISETTSQQNAIQIAQRLEQFLQDPALKPEQIQPALVKGLPAGKFGDRLLFTVDPKAGEYWDCNLELLAIRWVNNLRIALEEAPLALPVAQRKMHSLEETGERLEGIASWYGPYFHGRQTATGEIFDQREFTAAHPSLPFDTYLKVTNLNNGKSVIVRINDRGPYFENRTLDLSREAARSLGSETVGLVPIEADILYPASAFNTARQTVARSPRSNAL